MKVGIIATIGPSAAKGKNLRQMASKGMNFARLNFSWGTHKEHASYIRLIRRAARELGKKILIIQDLSGPRIENGNGHCFNKKIKDILTKKDLADLDFGAKQNIDYVAQSYVGGRGDILELRLEMAKRNFNKPIIAKIERNRAIRNLDEIIAESDALMIARGDLGNEMPLEQIPYVQEMIIKKAKAARKPVITATGMMLSMVDNISPAQADISDVTRAILEGADALMLSEETAIGKHPVDVISAMAKIIAEAKRRELMPKINPL